MVGWYHGLNGHEFERTPGDSESQGSLACCCPWGCKESDTRVSALSTRVAQSDWATKPFFGKLTSSYQLLRPVLLQTSFVNEYLWWRSRKLNLWNDQTPHGSWIFFINFQTKNKQILRQGPTLTQMPGHLFPYRCQFFPTGLSWDTEEALSKHLF